MNNYGEILESGAMKFERLLPGPIERVWSWLVDGDKRALWLAGGGNFTGPDQTVNFDFDNNSLAETDEHTPPKKSDCEDHETYQLTVTIFEPPHHMKWLWPSANHADSVVDIYLSEEGDKVRLTLIQHGYNGAEEMLGTLGGWHTHLDIMVDKMEGRKPSPFWPVHDAWTEKYREHFAERVKKLG